MCSKKADDTVDTTIAITLLAAYPQIKNLFVGYSGGVDSHVLLHLLAMREAIPAGQTLTAIYVNHHLHPAADDWEQHCRSICHELGVTFLAIPVDAQPGRGDSPEAAARTVRYAALAALLTDDAALLTAHHRDDQAETLLLQLLRGAGPRGLAAMPAARPLGHGLLLRPLLTCARDDILRYAKQHRLRWIDDPSNDNHHFDRNYLRHHILPLLRQRWPATLQTLARSAGLCAESVQLCDELAEQDFQLLTDNKEGLPIQPLLAFSPARQRNLLRFWLRRLQLAMPSRVQLQRVVDEMLTGADDRQPVLRWSGGEIRRFRHRLYAMPPLLPHDPGRVFPWTGDDAIIIPAIGTLSFSSVMGRGVRCSALDQLTIRFRAGGEYSHPYGRQHRRSLKKLLYEAAIPPWQRDRLPLLYSGNTLIAVADLWVEQEFAAKSDETGIVLRWQKSA